MQFSPSDSQTSLTRTGGIAWTRPGSVSPPVVPELLSLLDDPVVDSAVVDPEDDPLDPPEELGSVGLVIVALVLGPPVLVPPSVSATATLLPHAVATRLSPTPNATSDSQVTVEFSIATAQRTALPLSTNDPAFVQPASHPASKGHAARWTTG